MRWEFFTKSKLMHAMKELSGSNTSEKLNKLIQLQENLINELQSIRQNQESMQQRISLLESTVQDNLTALTKKVDEANHISRGIDDSARLMLMTSIMDNIDEMVGNKPSSKSSDQRSLSAINETNKKLKSYNANKSSDWWSY